VKPTFWQRLDALARSLAPFSLAFLLVLAGAVPLRLPHLAEIGPSFALLAVYYWAVHRPSLLPAGAVFLLGLMSDLLGAAPLGVGTAVLLGVYAVTVTQRRFLVGQSFMGVWTGFMIVCAGAFFVTWALSSLMAGVAIDGRAAVFAAVLNVGIYPAMGFIFAHAQRSLLPQA
jgi:rod shape-determining protein MreD